MTLKNKLVKGGLWIGLSLVITSLFAYLFRYILTKNVSVEDYGLYYAIVTVFLFITIFIDFGMGPAFVVFGSKYIAKGKRQIVKFLLEDNIRFRLKTGAIYLVFVILSANFLTKYYFKEEKAFWFFIILGVVYLITTIFFNFFTTLSQAHQDEKLYALNEIFKIISQVAFLLIFFYFNLGLWSPVLAIFVGPLFSSILFYTILYKKHFSWVSKIKSFGNEQIAKQVRKFAYASVLFTVGNYILGYTDTYMLTYFTTLKEVGLFNVAVPTARLVLFFSTALVFVLAPLSSSLYIRKNFKLMNQVINTIYKLSLLLFLPIGLILSLYPTIILKTVFSSEYVAASLALQLLSIGMLFNLFFMINTNIMVGIGKPQINSKIVLYGTIFNIVLNLLLTPAYGINGAATSTMLGYIFMCILSFYHLKKNFKQLSIKKDYFIKFILISVIFISVVSYLKHVISIGSTVTSGLIVLLITGIVYLALLFLTRIITTEMIKDTLSLLGGQKKIMVAEFENDENI